MWHEIFAGSNFCDSCDFSNERQKLITANIFLAKNYFRVCSTTTCLLRLEVGGRRRGRGTSSQTVPRPLSRFDTHPRWSLVTQSARYRRSYGKIGDCEQSTFSPIHFSQIVVVLYFFTSTDPNGFSVVGTMRSVSTRGSSLGCERDPIGL